MLCVAPPGPVSRQGQKKEQQVKLGVQSLFNICFPYLRLTLQQSLCHQMVVVVYTHVFADM